MDLFATLQRQQRGTPFQRSDEMRFFLTYSGVLLDYPSLARFAKAAKPFDIIRANILIRALHNKTEIEEEFIRVLKEARKKQEQDPISIAVEKTRDFAKRLPCLEDGSRRVYVPILSRSINEIYDKNLPKLLDENYKLLLTTFNPLIIDTFDVYGNQIFDSYFTKLIPIAENENIKAFYDYDSFSVYFVNSQGRLENQICLFDKGIARRNTNHMIERLLPVAKAYLSFNKEEMIYWLVENKLISSTIINKINSKETSLYKRMEKHSGE